VSAWVYPADELPFYATKDTASVTGYEDSVGLFGINGFESDNQNLKTYDAFNIWATNYLKANSFPYVTQNVMVDSFIPDEHYWSNGYAPYLKYTDSTLKYIDVLGTKITCPDYSIPYVDGDPQNKTFVITGLEYSWGNSGDKNIETTLILKRRMLPGEFD
jgi:hypothetical protein